MIPNLMMQQMFRAKKVVTTAADGPAYQVKPYDYYVNEFFLAKALIYVLHYITDEELFEIALDEAVTKYKQNLGDLRDLAVSIHLKSNGNTLIPVAPDET